MDPLAELVGESPPIEAVRDQIRRLLLRREAGRRLPAILINGETGSGKGLVAKTIHRGGPRAGGPFVDVNCAAIPETLLEAELFGFERGAFTDARRSKPGLFQAAHRGTIFLDEVGLLPESLQAKLLKVLEEQAVRRLGATAPEPIDVWIISATNTDLQAAVRQRSFREDLYHRLAVLTLRLPALRERGRDVLILAERFLARACADYGLPPKRLTPGAEARLLAYPWPGNVRELGNVMERVALLAESEAVTADMLEIEAGPVIEPAAAPVMSAASLDDAMREHVLTALTQCGWNISRTAARLGISRNTLRARIDKLGLRAGNGPAAPPKRAERAARRLPPAPDRAAAPAPMPTGPLPIRWEQRRVTFVRVRLVTREQDEVVSEAARALDVLIDKARSFGGRIEELGGRGIGVVFGLEPAEDAPLRAAHAAMAMQRAAEHARQDGGESFALRIAVHVGSVLVGRAAGEADIDADAKRAAWSEVEALLGAAEPGETMVSPAAAVFLQRRFRLRPLDPAQGGSSRGYTLSRGERPAGLTEGPAPTFVGRGQELGLLMSRLESARAGTSQIVGIVGEAGMGKSRLLQEFRRSLQREQATYLEGHCLSFGNSIPYLPALEIVRQACRVDEADTPDTVARKVGALLAALGMAAEESVPYLLHFLGIKAGAESLVMTGPDAIQSRTFDILRQMCAQSARQRPLIVAVEDVHWIDSASEALGTAIEGLATIPFLLIVTYRPGHRPVWMDKARVTQIALQPLSPDDSLTIVRAVAPGDHLPGRISEAILAKAEGNPFFLEELARAVMEREGGAGPSVPETIQEVLLARINQLPDDAKALLQTASILGREASRGLLGGLWRQPTGLEPAIQQLLRLDLLYERPGGEEPVYAFKHALIQEVAYASILERTRKAEHRDLGHLLEGRYAGRTHEVVELLAHHFGLAESRDKAVEYSLLAAEKAHRAWANAEALAHFDAARRHLETMPDSPAVRFWRIDAILKQGEVRFALGQHAEHLRHLDGIRTLVEEAGDPARRAAWCYWTGFLHSLTGSRPEVAIAYCREAVAIANAGGLDEIRAYAECCLALVHQVAGNLREAVEAGERALPTFEASGNSWWACRTLWAMITATLYRGEWTTSLAYCAKALALARAAKDRRLEAVAWWRTGAIHLFRGESAEGLRCVEEALALSPTPLDTAMIKMARGYGHVRSGDTARGIAELEESLEWFGRSQLHFTRSMTALRLCEGYLRHGDLARARALAEQVRAGSVERGYRHFEAQATRLLGECLLAAEPAAAARHLEAAMALFEDMGARNDVAKTLANQAELERAAGNRAAARDLLQRALGIFEELGTLDEPPRVRATLAAL